MMTCSIDSGNERLYQAIAAFVIGPQAAIPTPIQEVHVPVLDM